MQDELISDYIKKFPQRNFSKDTTILPSGVVSEFSYAIRSGYVKVISIDTDGREQLHWIAGRYDVIPTEAFFRKFHELDYFYTALSDVSVYEIPRSEVVRLTETNPQFALEVARGMSEHFDDLLYRVKSNSRATLREKIIFTLLFLCQRFGTNNSTCNLFEIGLTLTQQDIANMVGATRESTTIDLNKLRDEKLIDYSRTKFVIHCHKLQQTMSE